MNELNKVYLDYEGLALYDELIKSYIDSQKGDTDKSTAEVLKELTDYIAANDTRVDAAEQAISANETAIADNATAIAGNKTAIEAAQDAIDVLNGDAETEGSVANIVDTVVGTATEKAVDDAIKALIDNAPESLDTLKEIADWISADETGTAALVQRVSDIEDAAEALATKEAEDIAALTEKEEADIADLKAYVDTQDTYYWNHIGRIDDLKVEALFATEQKADETAADAIANVEAGKAVKLSAGQTITEDIAIDKDCYINANGAVFEGQVTVPAGANVIIENATFNKPVIVA